MFCTLGSVVDCSRRLNTSTTFQFSLCVLWMVTCDINIASSISVLCDVTGTHILMSLII